MIPLSEMKTLVERYGFDDGDPVVGWINMAKNEVQGLAEWAFQNAVVLTTLAPSVATIDFSVLGISKLIYLRDVDNKRKLKYIDRRLFADRVSDPTVVGTLEIYTWYMGMNSIQVYPLVSVTTNLEVGAQLVCADLVEDDDVLGGVSAPWPDLASNAVIYRAAAIALQSENEEERAQSAQQQYETAVTTLLAKSAVTNLDEAETVVDAQGYEDYSGRLTWRY